MITIRPDHISNASQSSDQDVILVLSVQASRLTGLVKCCFCEHAWLREAQPGMLTKTTLHKPYWAGCSSCPTRPQVYSQCCWGQALPYPSRSASRGREQ